MIKVETIQVGYIGTNCHIVYCDQAKEALVVDPGGDAARIVKLLEALDVKPVAVLNTHGHLDHIEANDKIAEKYNTPVLIHSQDAAMLTSAAKNLSAMFGAGIVCKAANRLLEEKGEIKLGNTSFRVIHTPGHTPGSCCFYTAGILISGDTLFRQSVGRTDFPGGSARKLTDSIKNKLFLLPDDTIVYPGHEENTEIGFEKKNNPFIL